MNNDDWATALAEAEDPNLRDAGLWARSFAEANGDSNKAKAIYVKARMGASDSPSTGQADPIRKDRGWCPVCHEPLDIDALHCTACNSSLSARGLAPLKYKPSGNPPGIQTYSSDRQVVKTAKSRGIYIILGLFFGCFGIHNFYAGRYAIGAIQFVITAVLGWFVIGFVITAIWAIVEMFTVKNDGAGDAMT